jgi:dipeptidyl aminopeptidase/acylaminoacyl peptidase
MSGALAALAALALFVGSAAGQSSAGFEPEVARSQDFELSIRSIMRGPALIGQAPGQVRWTDDSEWVYFRLYRVSADGTDLEEVPDDAADSVALVTRGGGFGGGPSYSRDGRWKVTAQSGDLHLVNVRDGSTRRLTETQGGESQPAFTPDGGGIIYRSGTNLFHLDLETAAVRQLTDIRTGSAPQDEDEAEGHRKFLEEQQEELFEHIRRQNARQEEAEARREAAQEDDPEPLYVANGERLGGLSHSPDGSWVVASTSRQARDAKQTMVPDWVTGSGYTEELNVRTKVGDAQSTSRLGLLNPATGEMTWLEAAPEGYDGEASWSANVMGWNDAGTHALVRSRSDDDQEWVLSTLDAASGSLTIVDRHRDDAWVGGPCGFGCMGWLPEANTVYYVSEETGFAHVYTAGADGSGKRALTSGEWEVLGLQLPEGEDRFFITTNEGSPFNQHIGWMGFDGERDYLTSGDGRYSGTLSPDGERIAITHDVANRPPELFMADADDALDSGDMVQVTDSPTDDWKSFDWIKPEIIRFTARDGVDVPARIYRPGDVGGTANGAAVVFVHGAGYLHNVHNYWSSYYREYMFHHLLAAQGYTVLDIDYRGSAGYGAEWRTGIYRFMGGKDLTDQEDGARWLVANEGIDSGRIGVYGGSYGGFITLMALTTGDQLFKSGAALRSVTDWAHYNDGYTSNILNDPQEDREAYVRSSPIYHVENFRADQHMLILHGMVDTNVHFSDVVRYAQRLIELGKENWEFAVYPVEGHGFAEPTSWTDEYRRIFELFERTISEPGCTADGGLCSVPRAGG